MPRVKYITVQDAAKLTDVNESTIRRNLASGKIKGKHFGGKVWQVDLKSLEAWERDTRGRKKTPPENGGN